MSVEVLLRDIHVAGAGSELLPTGDPVDLLIRDGIVVDIAPSGNLRHRGEVFDGEGCWAIPGLWDHHVHTVQWALAAQREPLGATRSASEAARRMASVPALGDGRRVGSGYRDALWTEPPSRALLDAATGTTPTYLINADVHSVWLNTAALRREGFIGADDDGVLREAPAFEISRRLNATDSAVADGAVQQAGRRAAARGVVGVVDFDMAWNPEAWARRVAGGFSSHRVECAVYPAELERAIAEGLATGAEIDRTDGLVRMGPLKVISDGSLGTRTAACSHPYTDGTEGTGALNVSADELHALLVRAAGAGLEAAVHAIGDVATTIALDAFTASGIQGTIEHAQLVRHADLVRFARLGVDASVQPQHAMDDRRLVDRLWAAQTSIAYPLASLDAAGAGLRFGSDAPVAPLDPWQAIASAVTRVDDDHEVPWHPEERISVERALRASAHHGTRGGAEIAPGAPADIALCVEDPRAAGADALRTMEIAATLVGGRFTHRG